MNYHKIGFSAYGTLHWSISRMLRILEPMNKPVHILFCNVDHFEPGTGGVTRDIEIARMDTLINKFPRLADKHKDCNGNNFKKTWFFPPHYHRHGNLKKLVSLCEKGYGEIELHIHHGETEPDTSMNFERTLWQCISEYSEYGIFGSENKTKKYGFIHGNWALDNSHNGKLCGVNNELEILKRTGCYADFTFPSMNISNPLQINSIYYATDNPQKPKSYNTGIPVRKGGKMKGDIMMIQGPVHPFFNNNNNKYIGLRLVGDSIDNNHISDERVGMWIKTGIHIKGRNNWIIVKTHAHGATDYKTIYDIVMDDVCYFLENKYNDGCKYLLHYVTARELYNIIKAIEAGEEGTDPSQYRDFAISPPKYTSAPAINCASEILNELIFKTYLRK